MAHEPLDPATARRVRQATLVRMDSRPRHSARDVPDGGPDLGEQGAIGRLARAFRPAAPSITPPERRP